jgi:fatty-acyl-CoA synthase
MLSYAHGASAVPLLGETIGENLHRTVTKWPDREALVVRHQDYRATYAQLWETVGLAARGLLALGVAQGDRVGLWSPNRYEWVILQYATARVGAILVSINPAYKTIELEHVLLTSSISLMFLSEGFRQTDFVSLLDQVRPSLSELRETVVFERDWRRLLAHGATISESCLVERERTLQFDDAVNIQYTSGTTGVPKGATLSHHSVLNNGWFVGETLHYDEHDRVCVPVPFYHCFGMVIGNLACTTHGACVVVPSESFDPLTVLDTVQHEHCTSLYGVPTMFIAELDHPRFDDFDLSTLRTGVMAGAPCPVEVMRRVRSRMQMEEVTIACGMTETAPVSTQTATDDPEEKRVKTVGRAHPHVEIKIIDPETGVVVPRGTPGEQCTRGYSIMLGYWNDDAATECAIDRAGWMHTGDLALMDDEGYIQIVGRLKDMIIRGGENIYPREIEEFLHTIPEVSDAQVVGVPDDRYGEEVVAWVKLRDGASLSAAQLADRCLGRIAKYKIPKYWKLVDTFPMTITGKVQKFRIREIAIEDVYAEKSASRVFKVDTEAVECDMRRPFLARKTEEDGL